MVNLDKAFEPIQQAIDRMDVSRVYGDVTREGDTIIIPVAEHSLAFGYGFGSGEGPVGGAGQAEGKESRMGTGSGGGGGGWGGSKPRGFIKITPDGVVYEPAIDINRLGLAGILLVAWNVFWVALAVRAFSRR
jgi:uncharacterized spore protein YtfJ